LDLDTGWLLENRKTASGIAFPKGPAVPLLTPSVGDHRGGGSRRRCTGRCGSDAHRL